MDRDQPWVTNNVQNQTHTSTPITILYIWEKHKQTKQAQMTPQWNWSILLSCLPWENESHVISRIKRYRKTLFHIKTTKNSKYWKYCRTGPDTSSIVSGHHKYLISYRTIQPMSRIWKLSQQNILLVKMATKYNDN